MKFGYAILPCVALVVAVPSCRKASVDEDPAIPSAARPVNRESVVWEHDHSVTWRPLEAAVAASDGDGHRFQRLDSRQTGVDFAIPIDTSHPLKRLYAGGFFCGGVAIGDVNGDGRPDIFLVSGPGTNGLFVQAGDLEFENVTERSGVGGGEAWGTGVAMIDIDNDGDLDIYVCNYDSPNSLYINQGDASFVESARTFGLDIVDCSVLPTFCDYDADGDLDCYLLTNRFYRDGGIPKGMKMQIVNGKLMVPAQYRKYYRAIRVGNKGQLEIIGRPDRLLRNDGSGTFTDVSAQAGISRDGGRGLSATWWDFDDDGLHDLYVGNDYNDADLLYHNNGDGTFTNVIETTVPHTTWFSMGADVGDINNDGLLDFLSADMQATTHYGQKTTMGEMGRLFEQIKDARPPQYMRNALYLNTGTDRFMEVAYQCGLASSDWTWAVRFADLDNDGRVDVYVTNGMTRNMIDSDAPFTFADTLGRTKWELYENRPTMPQQNRAFRNLGDLQLSDMSQTWGLDHVGMSFAAATGDLDRDGDLDLVVVNLDEPVSVYRNGSTTGHRVLVQLRGNPSNHWGVGSVVRVQTQKGKQIRQLIPATGYLSSNEPLIHFGLGDEDSIQTLTVDWPSGNRQTVKDLPADRFYTITEQASPSSKAEARPKNGSHRHSSQPALYRRSDVLDHARHVEQSFDDFQRQPLLPNKLSQLGPGVAVADVDHDGDDDLFVSGAAGQSGMLYLNEGAGRFSTAINQPFDQDSACEDMAPLFVDVDGDDHLDLYVVSGGVECEPADERLRDRLYMNDGNGNFTKARDDTTPDVRDSGGVVTTSDFDRDGDLDLFVGGRVIPGNYPSTPVSRILRNDDGRFVDVTSQVAPGILETGMVTGAIWSDVDDDGWIDLLIVHEWGPIKLFHNEQGHFVDQTTTAGLGELRGWWNGIAGRDLDGDGDIDYVVTNFGLNTKYHATPESPSLLYYGDLEGAGRSRIVEAEFEGRTLFPIRGKSCSTSAMPFLSDKFPTYKSFAAAALEDIYPTERLQDCLKLTATTLETGALINDGSGHMEFRPLPYLAQSSPCFGVVLTEVNGDAHSDVYVVQNFFSPQVETGRFDGGLSVLLQGKGDGDFEPIWPARSGLVLPEDAKGLAVTDLNEDGWPDFIVGINNDRVAAFLHEGHEGGRVLTVQLAGPAGNPTAVGARVTLRSPQGTTQTAEVAAGSGYLSQSTAALTFGLKGDGFETGSQVEVRWPDGSRSVHAVPKDRRTMTIELPE